MSPKKIFRLAVLVLAVVLAFNCVSCKGGEDEEKIIKWFDNYRLSADDSEKYNSFFDHPDVKNVAFSREPNALRVLVDGNETAVLDKTAVSIYFADLNGDGKREACVTYSEVVASLPEMDVGMMTVYDVWVYDAAAGKVCLPAERDIDTVPCDRVFKPQGDKLYLLEYKGKTLGICDVTAQDGSLTVNDASLGHEDYLALAGHPFEIENCVYFYRKVDGRISRGSYYILTADELASLNGLLESATWTEGEYVAANEFSGYVYVGGKYILFGDTAQNGYGNSVPSNGQEIAEFLRGLKEKASAYKK